MRQDQIEINGAIVFWKIAARSDRQKIVEGLTELGLGQYAPRERTPYTVLCEAARECAGKDFLIRPLEKRRGVAIVKERRGDVGSGNHYTSRAQVLCPTNGHVDVAYGLDYEQQERLSVVYAALKNALPPAAVGLSLSKIAVEALSGTRSLRESGGISWIPKHELPQWERVAAVIEGAAESGTSEVHAAWTADSPSTIRAIRNSIVEEITEAVSAIKGEIVDEAIGAKAIASRRDQLVSYGRKLGLYESVIGEALEDIRRHLEETQYLAAKAELVALSAST